MKEMDATPCRDYKSTLVPSGNIYRPDKHDPCKICICSNGSNQFCTSVSCDPPDPPRKCKHFVQKADECCKFECLPLNGTSHVKIISFETDSVKQGARFGATALTISIIISLFVFMIMRLKRRQALLNSLSQRTGLIQQNLLLFSDSNNNNIDNLTQLRRLLNRSRVRHDGNGFHRSCPSTSDFSHFLPVASLSATVGASGPPDLLLTRNPPAHIFTFGSRLNDATPGGFDPSTFNFLGIDLPRYEALQEKNEDWPPPYEAPPSYSELTSGEDVPCDAGEADPEEAPRCDNHSAVTADGCDPQLPGALDSPDPPVDSIGSQADPPHHP